MVDQVLDPDKPGPVALGVADILSEMEGSPKLIKFPIGAMLREKVYTFQFRYPKSSGDVRASRVAATDFLMRMRGDLSKLPQPYQDAMNSRDESEPMDDDDILNAFMLHYWSHPDEKISEPQALKLFAIAPLPMSDMVAKLDQELNMGIRLYSFGGVFEEKKDSKTTQSKNSDSKRPARTSKSTPTT